MLTTSNLYELRVDIESYDTSSSYITYSHMFVLDEDDDYSVSVGDKTDPASTGKASAIYDGTLLPPVR